MMNSSRTWLLACVLGFATLIGGARSAIGAVSLSDLVNNSGQILVGGSLLFDQFSFTTSGLMPDGDRINIDGVSDSLGNYGLRVHGGFSDFGGDGDSILNINYRVSSITPGMGLSGATLAGNPVVVLGNGSFTITESFAGIPTALQIYDSVPGSTDFLDSFQLPSIMSSLNVALSLVGSAGSGAVTASFVDQTFEQTPDGVVPEPSSIMIWLGTMMLFGIVPVTYRRWHVWPQWLRQQCNPS